MALALTLAMFNEPHVGITIDLRHGAPFCLGPFLLVAACPSAPESMQPGGVGVVGRYLNRVLGERVAFPQQVVRGIGRRGLRDRFEVRDPQHPHSYRS
jgi:hypothetical protein